MSYAVVWREDEGTRNVGKLELEPAGLHLTGLAEQRVPYADVVSLRILRRQEGLAARRPILVLGERSGSTVELWPLEGVGALHELADEIAAACTIAAA
jgi:hypothetical protein